MLPVRLLSALALTTLAAGGIGQARADFAEVRSILAASCLPCHGPDTAKRKADTRLDTVAGLRAKLIPGQPAKSELLRRVTATGGERMPPPGKGARLAARDVRTIERWIAQGAVWEPHWSNVVPQRPAVPGGAKHPIDAFVRDRLRREGLRPAAAADRHVLLRRVSLDLTGLPPTPAAADAFVKDARPDAWERVVDRLLASPAFGERWARPWLDLARYADSAGYADDPPRTIWAWRDWVIRALNANLPFDRFSTLQLAGDLLPEAADDELVATAFHRNTMTNSEGGTDDEEFRSAAVTDRVNTTMAVWMGATTGCAECHTHKYDPVTQKEYFRLYAFFNNTADADRRNEAPTIPLFTAEQQERKRRLLSEIAGAEAELEKARGELPRGGAWVAPQAGVRITALRFAADTTTPPAVRAELVAPDSERARGRFVRVTQPGRKVFLHLAEVEVLRGATNVARKGEARQVSTAYGGPARLAIDGNTNGHYSRAKSTSHTGQATDAWWEVDLGSEGFVDRIVVWNRTDSESVRRRLRNFRVQLLDAARKTVWERTVARSPKPKVALRPTPAPSIAIEAVQANGRREWTAILREPVDLGGARLDVRARAGKRTVPVRRLRATSDPRFLALGRKLAASRTRLATLREELSGIRPHTTVPVMRELEAGKRRKTHVHVRGNFLDKGELVTPGVPAAYHALRVEEPTRLDLARWLVSPDNPRTARVIVNRFWEQLFGRGLVATSEDFGVRGERPSHPRLLDWLATEFAGTWDVKALLRTIVTSKTYRQSSRADAPLVARDPANVLLARGPRQRLSAEMIRDQALAVSGLLSRKMFGPPVRPPRPKLGLRAAFGGSTDWQTSKGEDRYRRALYTSWRRSIPYPSMATFDAPSREVCTVKRIATNTPLQALVTMNDPVYVEAAQALARRIASAAGDAHAKAAFGMRLCVVRDPREREVSRLVELFEKARAVYAKDAASATAIATDPIGKAPAGADVTDLAAWTVVANTLLNLDEVLSKR